MSKIDDKYIKNLQQFTDALEGLVEQMKAQQGEGTEDVVNEMLKQIPDKLNIVIDNQKEIKKSQKDIKSDTSKILKEMKNIKKKEETGMFGKISDTDNKKKVVSAVKSIILIAAGVLAIGMAFKIVGKVDFASVVGLSLSILIMVEAFKKISEMNIGVTDMLFSGLMIILVSASLLGAGFILSKIPPITKDQGLSILLIAGSVGVAAWLIMKSIKKVDIKKNWAEILLLPIMMPLIAASIWLSSYFLSQTHVIGWDVGLSALIVAATMGVATYLILGAVSSMDIDTEEILGMMFMIPFMLPLIALGIVLSSIVLQGFEPIKNPWELIKGSFVIGLSILFMTPTVILVGKYIKSWKGLLMGLVALPIIAFGIVAVSLIYQLLPDFYKTPPLLWSIQVGLGMIFFLPTILIIGAVASVGVGLVVLGLGALGLILMAGLMVAVSYILNEGDWSNNFPSLKWALGVGASLILFGIATVIAAPAALVSGIFGILGGEDPLVKLAKSMVKVSDIISKGFTEDGDTFTPSWDDNYPSEDWAKGVGGALFMFTKAFAIIMALKGIASFFGKKIDFNQFVINAAEAMVTASNSLAGGNWSSGGYPSEDWAKGVGGALFMFTKAFAIIMALKGIASFFGKKIDFNQFVINAAKAMVTASKHLKGGNWKSKDYPSEDWAKGVGGALLNFTKSFAIIMALKGIASIFGKKIDFNQFVINAAKAMVTASKHLKGGNWKSKDYPSEDWAKGVGGSLSRFAEAFKNITDAESGGWFKKDKDFSLFVFKASTAMKLASYQFRDGDWSNYPEKEWSDNVSYGLLKIAKVVDKANLDEDDMEDFEYFLKHIVNNISALSDFPNIDPFIMNFEKLLNTFNNIPESKYKGIERLSESMRDFGDSLESINLETAQAISAIGQGTLLLTIIDEEKLKNVLDTIASRSEELKEITGGEEKSIFQKQKDIFNDLLGFSDKEEKETTTTEVEVDPNQQEFYDNVATMRGIMEEIRDVMSSPGQSGSFNKDE